MHQIHYRYIICTASCISMPVWLSCNQRVSPVLAFPRLRSRQRRSQEENESMRLNIVVSEVKPSSVVFALQLDKFEVSAFLGHELVVPALLVNRTLLDDGDGVRVLDGGQPVSNYDGGSPHHDAVQRVLHDLLRL
ncbi:hypothetical protein M758_2G057000 [Ceratodon purpureus]|nr:hypothetical protein M758_2G057000 [Ceratodon purpureus]